MTCWGPKIQKYKNTQLRHTRRLARIACVEVCAVNRGLLCAQNIEWVAYFLGSPHRFLRKVGAHRGSPLVRPTHIPLLLGVFRSPAGRLQAAKGDLAGVTGPGDGSL